jgi:uncharacterized RDD family membrane protein YckC
LPFSNSKALTKNPYQSPVYNEVERPDYFGESASRRRRIVNFLVDYFLVAVFWFGLLFILESAWLELRRFDFRVESPPVFPPKYDASLCTLITSGITSVVAGFYFFFFEALVGQTIGKFITSTSVVSNDNRPASVGQIFRRTVFRYIPWDCLTFYGPKGFGWHDKYSQTTVIVKMKEGIVVG